MEMNGLCHLSNYQYILSFKYRVQICKQEMYPLLASKFHVELFVLHISHCHYTHCNEPLVTEVYINCVKTHESETRMEPVPNVYYTQCDRQEIE